MTTAIIIHCDATDCLEQLGVATGAPPDETLREAGWSTDSDSEPPRHYCPRHAADPAAPAVVPSALASWLARHNQRKADPAAVAAAARVNGRRGGRPPDLIKRFNQAIKSGTVELVTTHPCPALGGSNGDLWRARDGAVYSVYSWVDGCTQYTVLGLVNAAYAVRAEQLPYSPTEDAAYARATCDLARQALASAAWHQEEGWPAARRGGWDRI